MSRKWLVALFVSIGLALVNSQNHSTISSNKESTTVSPSTSTTPVPTNSTTTSPPTTITTTTTTPVTTTTLKPTSAPTPPPIPKPEPWTGNVTAENKTCINVRFAIEIDISYNTTNGTQLSTGFTIPNNSLVDTSNSYCHKNGTPTQVLAIKFVHEEHTSASLTLTFNKTGNDVVVEAVDLKFNLTEELFPQFHDPSRYGRTVNVKKEGLTLFKVASAHSYVCAATQSADIDDKEANVNGVKIDFHDSKVEAYIGDSNKGAFDSEIDCKSAEISDVVPIAVGAALAGLVVIVLIAYFIGRRRSRRLAYQSV